MLALAPQHVAADDKAGRLTARDLIQLRELSGMVGNGMTVSPDGRYAAFEIHQADVASDSYRVAWHVLSLSGDGAVRRLAEGGDPTLFRNGYEGAVNGDWGPREAKWSPDSQAVAYLKKQRGAVQIWRSPMNGGPAVQMTGNAADVEDFFWSDEGDRIYFSTGAARSLRKKAEKGRAAKGYRVEKNFIPAYPSRLRIGEPYELLGGAPEVWVLDVKTGRERKASPADRQVYKKLSGQAGLPARPQARSVTYAGDDVAWLENRGRKDGIDPSLTLMASATEEGEAVDLCEAAACTGWFDGLWWGADKEEVVFQKREGLQRSRRALYAWNRKTGAVRRIYATTDWLSGCSLQGRRAICYLETPTRPRRIVAIDLAQGVLRELFNPNPEFESMRLGEVERLEWTNANGVGTWGYLVRPRDYKPGKRYPLIIVQYRPRMCLRGGVGGLGRAGEQCPSRQSYRERMSAAVLRGNQRLDAIPAFHPCRRCGAFGCSRPDRGGKIGALVADRHAVSALCPIADLHLRQGQFGPGGHSCHGWRASCVGQRRFARLPALAQYRRSRDAKLGGGMDWRLAGP